MVYNKNLADLTIDAVTSIRDEALGRFDWLEEFKKFGGNPEKVKRCQFFVHNLCEMQKKNQKWTPRHALHQRWLDEYKSAYPQTLQDAPSTLTMPLPSFASIPVPDDPLEAFPASLRLDTELDKSIIDEILSLDNSTWTKGSSAKHRVCSAIHFGLPSPRFPQMQYRGSKNLGSLESKIIAALKDTGAVFTSITINMYLNGDHMLEHNDHNLPEWPMQTLFVFGTFLGGALRIGGGLVQGTGSFRINGNVNHEVQAVEAGTRYSIVSYAKNLSAKTDPDRIADLVALGYPMPAMGTIDMPLPAMSSTTSLPSTIYMPRMPSFGPVSNDAVEIAVPDDSVEAYITHLAD